MGNSNNNISKISKESKYNNKLIDIEQLIIKKFIKEQVIIIIKDNNKKKIYIPQTIIHIIIKFLHMHKEKFIYITKTNNNKISNPPPIETQIYDNKIKITGQDLWKFSSTSNDDPWKRNGIQVIRSLGSNVVSKGIHIWKFQFNHKCTNFAWDSQMPCGFEFIAQIWIGMINNKQLNNMINNNNNNNTDFDIDFCNKKSFPDAYRHESLFMKANALSAPCFNILTFERDHLNIKNKNHLYNNDILTLKLNLSKNTLNYEIHNTKAKYKINYDKTFFLKSTPLPCLRIYIGAIMLKPKNSMKYECTIELINYETFTNVSCLLLSNGNNKNKNKNKISKRRQLILRFFIKKKNANKFEMSPLKLLVKETTSWIKIMTSYINYHHVQAENEKDILKLMKFLYKGISFKIEENNVVNQVINMEDIYQFQEEIQIPVIFIDIIYKK